MRRIRHVIWYCAGSDRTKGAYRKEKDVKGERFSHLPRRGRAGAEGTSVCFPCPGTVFRHASRGKAILYIKDIRKRSIYGRKTEDHFSGRSQ